MLFTWKWFSDAFWSESLWLSPGIKWADVSNGPDKNIRYPDAKDYYYQIPLLVMFLLLRYVVERCCFPVLGRALGIKNKKVRQVPDIPLLETAYKKSSQKKDAMALAKQLDMSERQVERWWRLRKDADRSTDMIKFCEHMWKGTFHGIHSMIGFYIVWDKDFFWDLDKCFIGHPHQGVTNDIWWFYMLYSAYTWSTTITVFFDVRRKDFKQMLIHHTSTGLLLFISWMASFYRIGLVLVPLQDGSEFIVELAKAVRLAKFEVLAQSFFYIFAVIWLYIRMYIFPVYILHSALIRTYAILTPSLMTAVLNVMLLIIMGLQTYWSVLIILVIYKYWSEGNLRDLRSSSSEGSDSNLTDSCDKKGVNRKGGNNGGVRSNGVEGKRDSRNGVENNDVRHNGVEHIHIEGNGVTNGVNIKQQH